MYQYAEYNMSWSTYICVVYVCTYVCVYLHIYIYTHSLTSSSPSFWYRCHLLVYRCFAFSQVLGQGEACGKTPGGSTAAISGWRDQDRIGGVWRFEVVERMNQNLTCCCVFCLKFEQLKFASALWLQILYTPNSSSVHETGQEYLTCFDDECR